MAVVFQCVRISVVLLCFFILPYTTVVAQEDNTTSTNSINSAIEPQSVEGIIFTGAPFLMISPNPIAASLGNSITASMPNSYDAMAANSKLAFLDKKLGGNFTYFPWFSNINTDGNLYFLIGSGFYKYKRHIANIAVKYLHYGQTASYDNEGNVDAIQNTPIDINIKLGYGYKLSDNIAVGINVGYIFSRVQSQTTVYNLKQASTIAADASVTYKKVFKKSKFIPRVKNSQFFDPGLDYLIVNFSAQNIGGKLQYSSVDIDKKPIPSLIILSGTYVKNISELNKFSVNLELKKILVPIFPSSTDEQLKFYRTSTLSTITNSFSNGMTGSSVALGFDYTYNDLLVFRTGYSLEFQANSNDFFALGVGINVSPVGIDVSYLIPSLRGESAFISPLVNSFRVGIKFNLY